MKRAPEYSDSARKKLVGEHLRNADKLLKSGDYDQALAEVEQSLTLEPGNFYAQAYKERIGALREKHGKPGDRPSTPPPPASAPKSGLGAAPPPAEASDDLTELTEASGARIEELGDDDTLGADDTLEADEAPGPGVASDTVDDEPVPGRGVAELKEQLERERASHEDETRRQSEELARQALEDELRARNEEVRLRAAEHEATVAAVAAAPAEALAAVVARAMEGFERALEAGDADAAYRDLAAIGIVDPSNPAIPGMSGRLDEATHSGGAVDAGASRTVPREIPLQWYGRILKSAWSEGAPNRAQAEVLAAAKQRFGVTVEEEQGLLAGIQREIALEAVREGYKDGEPDPESALHLQKLVRELSAGTVEKLRASLTS